MYRKILLLAGIIVPWLAPVANATTIVVNDLLINPSFENGNQASGCPIGWTCSSGGTQPGFSSAIPIFTAGSDGLPNNLTVPDGTMVAYSPTGVSGNGDMRQIISNSPVISTNIYSLDFWVGNPTNSAGFPSTSVSLLKGTSTANLCGSTGNSKGTLTALSGPSAGNLISTATGDCVFNIPDPGIGKWVEYEVSLINVNSSGANLGVDFNNGGATNGKIVVFDMSVDGGVINQLATNVPEPASFLLFGTSAMGLVWARRSGRKIAGR